MEDKNKYKDILEHVRTKENKVVLLSVIAEVKNGMYQQKEEQVQALFSRSLPVEINDSIMRMLSSFHISLTDYEKLKRFLDELEVEVGLLEVLQMILAFEPGENTIQSFSSWIKENIGDDLVIQPSFDRRLIGGAIFIFKGKYLDYSLRKHISDVGISNPEVAKILA